ncbi:3-oxoacyl-[acyl-carrier protein] reductase [Myxococcaceae bacterium]|jgi:3-oxoacyl-[acyl-carrier protein] reductase|nr:3-oxoacyl-[acyl-carrier protein] reductase [Myxococcaceae bacterium]
MPKLDGQWALVTGGASGLGRAISKALAAEGARVAVADLDGSRAAEAIEEIGGRGLALSGDVSDSKQVAEWFVRLGATSSRRLDILVNNAGYADGRPELLERAKQIAGEVLSGKGQQTPLDATATLSDEDWARMLAVHLNGTFYCTREALRWMTPARYGRIVNMASIAATTGLGMVPHYCAAKGGIVSLTKSVAKEVMPFGITVNAIAPGFIDTPLLDPFDALSRMAILGGIPMGRFGRPEEVVPSAMLLVDPANSFMTGQVISPNGGQVI